MDSLKNVLEEVLVAKLRRRSTYVAVSDFASIRIAVFIAQLIGKIKTLECTICKKEALIDSQLHMIRNRDVLIEFLEKVIAKKKIKSMQIMQKLKRMIAFHEQEVIEKMASHDS